MKYLLLFIVLMIAAPAYADAPPAAAAAAPQSSAQALAPVVRANTGWGPSFIMNMGTFGLKGNYTLLSAGAAGGISYKFEGRDNNPYELGLYVGPQVQQVKDVTTTTVNTMLHLALYKAIGIGFGLEMWRSGEGLEKASAARMFFALGYGLTN